MADYSWVMRLYDRAGNPITANYAGYSDVGTTNTIAHATDRQLGLNLNGIDDLNFSIYLDDPMAKKIQRLTTFVKLWRTVPGYSDPSNQPCFVGQVGYHQKDGESNIMRVKAYSPFWRLQFRFHLLNHYLKTNPDTATDYKQSDLIWRLIYFTSNAFGPTISATGIAKGTFYDLASEVIIAPYFQPKGANVWTEIFDGVLIRPGSVDIIPRYSHVDGNSTLVYFDTALKRGSDVSASVNFSYHTSAPSNCINMVEEEFVAPGEDGFANYLWAVGAGGPNSGKVAVASDSGATGLGYNAIGIYMKRLDFQDIKRVGILGANPPQTATHLRAKAISELAKAIVPKSTYSITMNPASSIYYGKDFKLGDVAMLNANKGALVVSNKKQRIYQVGLSISDNNMETVSSLVSDDFFGKII